MLTRRLPVDKLAPARFVSAARPAALAGVPPPPRVMNRRVLIALCIAGALAFACGPRTNTDAAQALRTVFQQSHSRVVPVQQAGAPARKSTAHQDTLSTKFTVLAQAEEVRFAFEARNEVGRTIEVSFPTGQEYDFIVTDSTGREAWRWSARRLFTQSVQNRLLSRNEAIRVSEGWADPRPGSYVAVARLRSSNYPVEHRVAFVIR